MGKRVLIEELKVGNIKIDWEQEKLLFQRKIEKDIKAGKKVVFVGESEHCGVKEVWALVLMFGGRGFVLLPTEEKRKFFFEKFIKIAPVEALFREISVRLTNTFYKIELLTGAIVEIISSETSHITGFTPNWIWADKFNCGSKHEHEILLSRLFEKNGLLFLFTTS